MRILILSTSVGGGHLRAAEAVESALRGLRPDALVENVDVLTLTNAAFRRVYAKLSLDVMHKAPHLHGYLYDQMDKPRPPDALGDRLRIMMQKPHLRRFLRLLQGRPWDVVVNTHFLGAEMLAWLRRKGRLSIPQAMIPTDFGVHRMWVVSPCERYFAACDEAAATLECLGVPRDDIRVTGIPVHPEFSKVKDRAECLARHGLQGDRPVILQLSGGFGVGPVEELHQLIAQVDVPCDVVVVAGRNEVLRGRLREVVASDATSRHRTHVLGFTDQMDELMLLADVVVSKPGGLTSSEALARGAVLAIVHPVPGQETRNSSFLLEQGAAIAADPVGLLPHKLGKLLEDHNRLAAFKANARKLGRPEAAHDVARHVIALAERS